MTSDGDVWPDAAQPAVAQLVEPPREATGQIGPDRILHEVTARHGHAAYASILPVRLATTRSHHVPYNVISRICASL